MKVIDDEKNKVKEELRVLQRRLALLEEFEVQGYTTQICEEPYRYHEWTSVQWEDGWNGLRYDEEDSHIVKDLHICMNCGVIRRTVFTLSDTEIEDPFDVLREEE